MTEEKGERELNTETRRLRAALDIEYVEREQKVKMHDGMSMRMTDAYAVMQRIGDEAPTRRKLPLLMFESLTENGEVAITAIWYSVNGKHEFRIIRKEDKTEPREWIEARVEVETWEAEPQLRAVFRGDK